MRIKQSMTICFGMAFIFLIIAAGTVAADTITVDDDPGADYSKIQDAVNNANSGDTIIVYPGTYAENVDVNKELIIISQSGYPDDTIVQAANPDYDVFYVTADNVTVSGFSATGAFGNPTEEIYPAGIGLNGVQNNTVSNNNLSNNGFGISLVYASNNTLSNNIASNNDHDGIQLSGSSNNTLSNNTVSNNDHDGIFLYDSSNNTLSNNIANSNNDDGISLNWSSSNNTLSNNIASNNYAGILLYDSSNNTLSNNIASNNDYEGIYLYYSSNNALSNNTASNNLVGIWLYDSSNNTLSNNYALNNDYGIYLVNSSNNIIYNNYFNNTNNVEFYGTNTGNVWNIIQTTGSNIIGGPFLGGNYWATPSGTGHSQTCTDADGDGLCDSPYNIDERNTDYLPLTILDGGETVPEFNPYDTNKDCEIGAVELNAAITDFLGGQLGAVELNELITYFLSGEPYQSTTDETIRVGAFNIQVFGTSKASKPEVMEILAEIIRTYDIVAIQEIRDISQTALPALVDEVNSDGSQYDYVVSERLGRTISKEQYAYIYNTQTIELTGTPHTYPEPSGTDPFHRQPYITSFSTLNGNFDAVLITIHTDPDEATEEINTLDDVIEYTKSTYPGEQDFMIIGDLNADGSYFNENSASDISGSEYAWIIDNSQDTTTKSTYYTYDRIIITDTSDFTGDSGVFRFDAEYGLNYDETVAVSDHYPVYAEFWCNRDDDSSTTPSQPAELEPEESTSSSSIQIDDLSLQDEWVKITNTGSSSISLKGWKIVDDGNKHTYIFPSFTLSSGATVTLYTGNGVNTATELYWGSGRPIWNNDGDTVYLYNSSGKLVDMMDG